jgi:hypothetical protein
VRRAPLPLDEGRTAAAGRTARRADAPQRPQLLRRGPATAGDAGVPVPAPAPHRPAPLQGGPQLLGPRGQHRHRRGRLLGPGPPEPPLAFSVAEAHHCPAALRRLAGGPRRPRWTCRGVGQGRVAPGPARLQHRRTATRRPAGLHRHHPALAEADDQALPAAAARAHGTADSRTQPQRLHPLLPLHRGDPTRPAERPGIAGPAAAGDLHRLGRPQDGGAKGTVLRPARGPRQPQPPTVGGLHHARNVAPLRLAARAARRCPDPPGRIPAAARAEGQLHRRAPHGADRDRGEPGPARPRDTHTGTHLPRRGPTHQRSTHPEDRLLEEDPVRPLGPSPLQEQGQKLPGHPRLPRSGGRDPGSTRPGPETVRRRLPVAVPQGQREPGRQVPNALRHRRHPLRHLAEAHSPHRLQRRPCCRQLASVPAHASVLRQRFVGRIGRGIRGSPRRSWSR